MHTFIPLLSLALSIATTALGMGEDPTSNLNFCKDSAHKKFLEPTGHDFGNLTVPSFKGTENNRYCFHFVGNFEKKEAFPSDAKVGITVYNQITSPPSQDLLWDEIQPLCKNLKIAPPALGCSLSSFPNIVPDDHVIYGCVDLVTTDLETDPGVKGENGVVYVDFYNKEDFSFLCAFGDVKFI
ncbi:hypothetical protein BKA57DRAFT_494274 [Linnemannia elongata]|nr:hypothetical protein BKA57DRAFT_494274 [Linnemannia elongata]